ncbi:hypothetical protein KIN34_13930 [Cellulomonas sp. DKR-3]|uniref:AMIN-like domain-containing protein n=1 Tax=Cellulomonas fulva TaxID=2835530 RepID=A0ABS5U1V6_9CELL|nr:hypothetical protein [Cellulomonas fulva]MBT0995384.1 hypothetical protein [Cellulomonas fulva]
MVLALAAGLTLVGCEAGDPTGAGDGPTAPATAPSSDGATDRATPAEPTPAEPTSAEPTSTEPTSTDPTSTDPTSAEPDGGPFADPGTVLEQDADGGVLTVVDVRTGRHDGFERVVYELAGTGLPGWRVEYVEEAVDDPSGEVVDVPGPATLQVVVTGTAYPDETGHDELARDVAGAGAVLEVTRPLTFEGASQSFVGLDERRPFRVTLLRDPARVVLDVRT